MLKVGDDYSCIKDICIKIYSIYSIYCFGQCSPTADRRPNLSYLHNLYTQHTPKTEALQWILEERKLKRGCFREEKTVNMKKLNCSPEYKTGSEESCYNKRSSSRSEMRTQNRESRRRQIQSDTFKDVYDDLKTKMQKFGCVKKTVGCKPSLTRSGSIWTRSCSHPDEWDKNPTEWLSNYDINSIMKQYDQFYPNSPLSGRRRWTSTKSPPTTTATACATICNFKVSDCMKGIRKVGFTINLDNHNESGSHWVSMFLDLDDKIISTSTVPEPRAR
jgi:hypothetical protein